MIAFVAPSYATRGSSPRLLEETEVVGMSNTHLPLTCYLDANCNCERLGCVQRYYASVSGGGPTHSSLATETILAEVCIWERGGPAVLLPCVL